MNTQTIITDKCVFGGNCLSKINGKAVFVPFAVPGETLEVEITQSKRDYDSAEIRNIIKPSEHRVKPECPYYGTCGGCNMMHIDSEYQKELRAEMLKDAFVRNGITPPEIQVICGENFGYRSRFQLSDGGLSARGTNTVIPIERCAVAENCINEWLLSFPMEKRPSGRCHIFGSGKVVSAGGKSGCSVSVSAGFEKDVPVQPSKKFKNMKQVKKHYAGTVLSEETLVTVELLGKKITFDARGFFQSNLDVLEKAVREICRGLCGNTVLDMYAGCGTFSVFLSDIFEKTTLVEHNRDALVFAEQNLSGKNHESIGLSGAKWAAANRNAYFDAAVIDPPRSGMEKEVREYLCRSGIPQIRSVSCDPATQARDTAALVQSGYVLKRLYLLDFYPNTSHIESLAVLEKE